MAMDFNKALQTKASDVERPPIAPTGHFVWQIMKIPVQREGVDKNGDKYTSVDFQCRAIRVYEEAEDVDLDELKAYGKVTSIMSRKGFYFNSADDAGFQSTMFQMTTFLRDHLGIEDADSKSVGELMNDCVNKQFVGEHRHRPNAENPENPFSEIGKTAPLD